jgi:hypothetical protein
MIEFFVNSVAAYGAVNAVCGMVAFGIVFIAAPVAVVALMVAMRHDV